MDNRIEKIRAEVERRIKEGKDGYGGNLKSLLSFIDSLQEDPVSEGKDIFDNCLKSEEKFILPQKISGNINCENCLYSSACALGDIQACIIDKPVSEELEDAADKYSQSIHSDYSNDMFDSHNIYDAVIYGANWQRHKEHNKL